MQKDWPTKDKDIQTAKKIIETFASEKKSPHVGLMEIAFDPVKKRMDFRLSGWVVMLAKHFNSEYGFTQGDFVTRQVISRCITQESTIH